MSKNLPEVFDEMSKNLDGLDSIFNQTLLKYGYERSAKSSEGRYPRKRYFKNNDFCGLIDFTMDFDKNGQRFEEFWPEAPFTLWCGSFIDISGVRYHGPQKVIFRAEPFEGITNNLESKLLEAVAFLSQVSVVQILRSNNTYSIEVKHNKLLHLTQWSSLLFVHSLRSLLHKNPLQSPRK